MISKFQELQTRQAKENEKELELLKNKYKNTIIKLNKISDEYKKVELQYMVETDKTKNILLKRELRILEDEILNLNNKIQDMEAKKLELKYTDIDYSIGDIIKDLNTYLKIKKVAAYGERLIKAKEDYIKAIENVYLEAKEVHREVQELKESMCNNYGDEVLEQYNIKSINQLMCDDGKVDRIKIKILDINLIDNASAALGLLKGQKALCEQKIKNIYQTINNI